MDRGDERVGLVADAGGGSSGDEGLLAPAAGLLAPLGVGQRLCQGGGDPGSQPCRRIMRDELLGAHAKLQLLLVVTHAKILREPLAGAGRPERIDALVDLGDGLPSKADRPINLPRSARRLRRI
jgi:hypothetical protein